MKDFSKKFYKSKAWEDCRAAFYFSKHGLCECCQGPGKIVHHRIELTPDNINNPDITLNWDNLELVCLDCHNSIHKTGQTLNSNRIRSYTAPGTMFDENGDLVPKKDVTIVWGAPASGKTTYVREHFCHGDIVVDMDILLQSISLSDIYKGPEDLKPYVFTLKEELYKGIANRIGRFNHAWIIAGLPRKDERKDLCQRLKAELIHMDATEAECIKRIHTDQNREDKSKHIDIAKKYFKQLEV